MYTLLNAVERNKEHPNTFEIPSRRVIKRIKEGYFVKLCFIHSEHTSERMWVKVTEIDGDNFKGILSNSPIYDGFGELGDIVEFTSDNILNVIKQ